MADLKPSEVDAISSTEHSEVNVPAKKVAMADDTKPEVNEKDIGRPADPERRQSQKSVYSSSGRKVSGWEALQMVAAGDLETINREMDDIEADLQTMNIKSTWYKPQLRLNDPRYFTWLLVGKFMDIRCSGRC